jgi:hypothetical protein
MGNLEIGKVPKCSIALQRAEYSNSKSCLSVLSLLHRITMYEVIIETTNDLKVVDDMGLVHERGTVSRKKVFW